jgi:hypothetical protein
MRMIPLVIGIAMLAAFGVLAPGSPGSVAVAATPTPTPVALQYDEISRVIMAPATPPAPGTFGEDYQVAMSAAAPQATPSNIETPAARPHGIMGSLSGVIPGMPGGSNTGEGPPAQTASSGGGPGNAPSGAMGMMNLMRTGHLMRYTFYYTKGWIREEDPVARTATISKCNEHIFITLDLAKRTYTQTNTQPQGSNCFQMPMSGGGSPRGGGAQSNAQPGTEDLTIDATAQDLGPKTIEGIPTTGSSSNLTMASTNATGSCKNSQFGMARVVYVSRIGKPRAYCPLTSAPLVASDPTQVAAQGGCKPTLHGGGTGMNFNSQNLEMYLLMTMQSAEMRGRSMGMLTERGHVTWFLKPQADPLFEVPAGFTPA